MDKNYSTRYDNTNVTIICIRCNKRKEVSRGNISLRAALTDIEQHLSIFIKIKINNVILNFIDCNIGNDIFTSKCVEQ